MNKPILSVVSVSVICSVGFIAGYLFNDAYDSEKKLVSTTIAQYSKARELFDWYGLIVSSEMVLKDLNSLGDIKELEPLKEKYKNNARTHIKLFREKASEIKKEAVNIEAIETLEKEVTKIESLL